MGLLIKMVVTSPQPPNIITMSKKVQSKELNQLKLWKIGMNRHVEEFLSSKEQMREVWQEVKTIEEWPKTYQKNKKINKNKRKKEKKQKDSLQRGELIAPNSILEKFRGDICKSEEQEWNRKMFLKAISERGILLKRKSSETCPGVKCTNGTNLWVNAY